MDKQLEARPYTAWQLIKSYWQSEERLSAFTLLGIVFVFTIVLVAFEVAFTTWYNYFYNALQDYDRRSALDLLIVFLFLAAINIVIAVYRYYVQQFLALRWRRWLTSRFLERWLKGHSYYLLENFYENTDNPDQRIQEDIASLSVGSLALAIGMLNAVVTILAFIYVLWTLSGVITFSLGRFGTFHIPGYLVWVGIIYASIGTWIAFKIGYPLVPLNFEQQRREANFRFGAIDLRAYSENVALYRGENNQKTILQRIFSGVLENWYAIILRQKLLLWFTASYNQIAVILPLVVALPNYFNKFFKLGGLIQALSSFTKIQDALSFFVNSYVPIAEWRAVMRRLTTFINHMYEIDTLARKKNHFKFVTHSQNKIITRDLTIDTPKGERLLQQINEELIHGRHYVIKGDSGIGKSTFVRTLANIWPFGSGDIVLPSEKKILFLPQRPYMPLGTLRESLLFPDKVHDVSDSTLMELLEACELSNLTNQLYEVTRWRERLSPGEMQRIAFVRVLIQKPDWVFLDESTSSLDLRRENHLYQLLKTRLPNCSLVSVGHRPSLDQFHDQIIQLEKYQASLMPSV